MCTVTFIPSGDKIFLASSRDEKAERFPADPPAWQIQNGITLLYPRDTLSGGTWMAVNGYGTAGVLLNGGRRAHIPKPAYRKSRGLVMLDLMAYESPSTIFRGMSLQGIEPFTLILFEKEKLISVVWDGKKKYFSDMNRHEPQIFSSSTLYDPAAVRKREKWFGDWLNRSPFPELPDVFGFHLGAGDGDPRDAVRMDREGKLFTQCIGVLSMTQTRADFSYLDLTSGVVSDSVLTFTKTTTIPA